MNGKCGAAVFDLLKYCHKPSAPAGFKNSANYPARKTYSTT
jgi:hypothetical protein